MHTSMRRTLITGGLLAVFAALLAQFGGALGLDEIRSALLGAALGAVLGLVPTSESPIGRAAAFIVGFVLGWIGYALRAGVLPDTGAGRAIAAFLVIVVLTGICAAAVGFLPLWSGLLGVAAIAGAYEFAFGVDPTAFTSESITAATTVLLAAAVGFLVGGVGAAFSGAAADADHPVRTETPSRSHVTKTEAAAPSRDTSGMEILDERPTEA
jgi:hypothetical protein